MNRGAFVYLNEKERKAKEKEYVIELINIYLEEIKRNEKDIFDKNIAFKLSKKIEGYEYDTKQKGKIESISIENVKIPIIRVNTFMRKFSFKERIKILFRGKLW